MRKAVFLAVGIVIVFAILAGVLLFWWAQQGQPVTYLSDFESGLGEWIADADVPEDPNRPGESVAWKTELVSNESFSGSNSVLFYIDGSRDDGTIWIERKLSVEPNVARVVNVSFQLWSESESFNAVAGVVGYVGETVPEVEEDFQVVGAANEIGGWKTYSFSSELTSGSGDVYVALGISVRWETEMTYLIDDAMLTIGK